MIHIGLIGNPVAHSYSPRFQQAALDALGLAARYELWQTAEHELPARIASLRDEHCLGANVTIPYKESVMALLDSVDPLAAQIGAVNTIVNRSGQLSGYNTDAPGLLYALSEQGIGTREQDGSYISLQGYNAVLLGAGGAARGAAFALLQAGVSQLTILNRHLERAQQLAANLSTAMGVGTRFIAPPTQIFSLNDADFLIPHAPSLIINATALGMHEDASPLTAEILARFAPDTFVFDMIYHPTQTRLLCQARTLGLRTANGLLMLLYQGALAFTLWTGQPAPLEVMRSRLF